jgi:serine/threonine-protein kinase
MTLIPGTRLGPYEIQTPIAAGGMGEVYKALDTRLDRVVAVKILLTPVADDPEFRARFEREARAISQLQHPHICTLHDIGSHEGTDYLVLEHLEGQTLADRITRGPVPLAEALTIASQVTDALDKAHRLGIIHRDLKPGNVMLTRSGAKLLDFGLAKTVAGPAPGATDLTAAATRASPLTGQGTILGTFQYMAPEQIEGAEADARTDIWAVGCLLHEMLTGRRTFEGKTHASLIGSILKDQPPPVSVDEPLSPPALDRVIAACLAKDPDDRWQSAADLTRELKWMAASAPEKPVASARPAGRGRERLAWIAAVVVTAIAAVLAARWPGSPVTQDLTVPAVINLDPAHPALARQGSSRPGPVLSPDGRFLAYAALVDGEQALVLRDMTTGETRPVPDSLGSNTVFFSPDSRSLGFSSAMSLQRMTLSGGAPITVVDGLSTNLRGAAWGDDGYIYYTPFFSSGLFRVAAVGGSPEQLTTPDAPGGEKTHRYPVVLPGSRAVLFVVATARHSTFDDANIELLDLNTGGRRVLIEGGTFPQYVPTGHLLYSRGESIVAVPFDVDRLEVTGEPVVVADQVMNRPSYGSADFSISTSGLLVSVAPQGKLMSAVLAVDRAGRTEQIGAGEGAFQTGRMSPDEKRLAVFLTGATSQISVLDVDSGRATGLTFEWDNEYPLWTADGQKVIFQSNFGGGPTNLFWRSADGSGQAERLTTSDNIQWTGRLSSPGPFLPYWEEDPGTGSDIWVLSLEDRTTELLVQTPFEETFPAFSPDGRWLAYQSNQSGSWEVIVQTYPSDGRRWTVSSGQGTGPIWHPTGRELFYRDGDAVMVVAVAASGGFVASRPVKLFDSADDLWGVFADGRLLMRRVTAPPSVSAFNLTVNWFSELRRKMDEAER